MGTTVFDIRQAIEDGRDTSWLVGRRAVFHTVEGAPFTGRIESVEGCAVRIRFADGRRARTGFAVELVNE